MRGQHYGAYVQVQMERQQGQCDQKIKAFLQKNKIMT